VFYADLAYDDQSSPVFAIYGTVLAWRYISQERCHSA
jgi:hypothetical protein